MKKVLKIWLFAVVFFTVSCNSISSIDDSTIDGNVRKTFVEWSKGNINTKYSLKTITYDTVGCPMDFMFSATMLEQTVGATGQTESEINKGLNLIGFESVLDSSFLTTNIHIANVQVQINDSICTYYIGMRGDSICTTPQKHGYEALVKTHHEGEQHLYDACNEIFINLGAYAREKGGSNSEISKDDFYSFWINLPSYKEYKGALGK